MGNYKFRLSEIIPNAWFYKLKEMGNKTRSMNRKNTSKKKHQNQTPSSSSSSTSASRQLASTATNHPQHRKSYYFTRDLNIPPKTSIASPEQPRKSSKKRRNAKICTRTSRASPSPRLVTSSASTGCSCQASLESLWTKPDSALGSSLDSSSSEAEFRVTVTPDQTFDETLSLSASCGCSIDTIYPNEIEGNQLDTISPIELPPIITKSSAKTELSEEDMVKRSKEHRATPVQTYSGLRLKTRSPRIASKRTPGRKSVSSQSFAVVKTSQDPRRDFWESMVEMIVEHNIRGSKDLEDLLACYLSLNSDEYHDLIIKVFKQIWFDVITNVRLK